MQRRFLLIVWIISAIILFLYSFTQVDLGLTLTRASVWQTIQRAFQSIGYFNRPLSTYIFIFILLILTTLYLFTLRLIKDGKLTRKELWMVILAISVVLFFSYNAFSYDLFNYIFDAKIVTYYHQNPYVQKALDYPGDPMLSFMHWTHRTYPYGPVWLGITVPISFISLNYFIINLYLFRLLVVASYVGSLYFLEKILHKTKVAVPLFGLAFFALNPMVIIETLVSAHNDIVMIFLTLVSLYLFLSAKYVFSIITLLLSIGIKFGTAVLLPVYIFYPYLKIYIKNVNSILLHVLLLLMIIPVFFATVRTNYQPWYLLLVLPFAALLSHKPYVFIPSVVISIFSLFHYAPFLYTGNWDDPIPQILTIITISSIIISVILIITVYLLRIPRNKISQKA